MGRRRMENGEITEPLLSSHLDHSPQTSSREAPGQAPTPPRSLLQTLCKFLTSVGAFFASLWHKLVSLFPGRNTRPQLSLIQASRWETLQVRASIMYEADDESHQEILQRLWAAAWPAAPFPEAIKSGQWKEMGWQGDNPATDIRGGGLLSIELLVYLAETDPDLFLELMLKRRGPRSDWDYPFAAAGVNLTYMLIESLELRKPGHIPCTRAAQGFFRILSQEDTALESLFIESFKMLDQIWVDMGATYMEFPQVMHQVKQKVGQLLELSNDAE